jgi:hypothetical protein
MIKAIEYGGPLITDTSIPGETKRDGVIPAHPGGGPIRVSEDRWINFFARLDPRGSDANGSILYQIRADAPDGRIIREGSVYRVDDKWDPLGRGDRLSKCAGMPIAFGVPMGAVLGGRPMPNANVFVLKWYFNGFLLKNNRLLHPCYHAGSHEPPERYWAEGPEMMPKMFGVDWTQFRLNDQKDDIELLFKPAHIRQKGYESGDAKCEFGADCFMNHSMKAACPTDSLCNEWITLDGFTSFENWRNFRESATWPQAPEQGDVAPVLYRFNPNTRLYEWVRTGPLLSKGRRFSEASVNRIGKRWVAMIRMFNDPDNGTRWQITEDPMGSWGEPIVRPHCNSPRTAFVCADGVLRMFSNDEPDRKKLISRCPLYCWDVDPDTFEYSNRQMIFDARQHELPFQYPYIDMPKLSTPNGTTQFLLYRTISRGQTSVFSNDSIGQAQHDAAGIYYSKLHYDRLAVDTFQFA